MPDRETVAICIRVDKRKKALEAIIARADEVAANVR